MPASARAIRASAERRAQRVRAGHSCGAFHFDERGCSELMATSHELYLIRHGVAEERSEAWPDDTKRPLTSEGMSRLRRSARALDRLGIYFDVVLTSPLVRTR